MQRSYNCLNIDVEGLCMHGIYETLYFQIFILYMYIQGMLFAYIIKPHTCVLKTHEAGVQLSYPICTYRSTLERTSPHAHPQAYTRRYTYMSKLNKS